MSLEMLQTECEARGREEGKMSTLYSLVRDGLITAKEAAIRCNQTEADFLAGMQANG